MLANIHDAISSRGGGGDSSSSRFYFQQNTTMEQYQEKHFVDISKHIETLLHLTVVTQEATGLIKLATKIWYHVELTYQMLAPPGVSLQRRPSSASCDTV